MRATSNYELLTILPLGVVRNMDVASSLSAPKATIRLDWRITPLRLAALLSLLALAVRLVGLGTRPLWLDEAYSAWFAARDWHYLWTVVPTYEPHPPFYYSILKLWAALFGSTALSLRCLSVLFGVATVPVVVAAAFELEKHKATGRPLLFAALAGAFAACSPLLVALGQEARPYPLLTLGFAVAILGLLRLMREFRSGAPGAPGSWFVLCFGTTLVLWAHPLGILYAGCLGVALLPVWLHGPADRARLVRGLVAATAITLFYLPCLLIIAQRAGDWGTGWLRWRPIMATQLVALYSVPFDVLTAGSTVAAVMMLLLVKRAVQSAATEPGWNSERAIVLLWLAPPIVSILISALYLPIFIPRTLAPTLVPAYLAMAGALARSSSRRERIIVTAALMISLLPGTLQTALRQPQEPWDRVAEYLKQNVRPGDEVWLYPNDSALPLNAVGAHALPERGIPGDFPAIGFKGPIRAGCPAVVSLTHDQAEALANRTEFRRIRTIWLVTRRSDIIDPEGELPKALAHARRAGQLRAFSPVAVQPFYATVQ
jgi:mannosyltransferase